MNKISPGASHGESKAVSALRSATAVHNASGGGFFAQHLGGFDFVAKLAVGFVEADDRTGARGKTAIRVQGETFGREELQGFAHALGAHRDN